MHNCASDAKGIDRPGTVLFSVGGGEEAEDGLREDGSDAGSADGSDAALDKAGVRGVAENG